ncbi:hypothetical protein CI610_00813 [invertebrate metagenome]|uniref:Retropepsin-like aspartic endopeptidase domain-containing protein n=1 Tax=invertebrate metagenome TaxID=1711999 RepID=A0A2H9TAD1_9ZZZZ
MIHYPALFAVLASLLMTGCNALMSSHQAEPSSSQDSAQQLAEPIMKKNIHEPSAEKHKKAMRQAIYQIPSHIEGRLLVGRSEKAFLPEQELALEAKMDTGAAVSSIDARSQQIFERDGKKWVKFIVARSSESDASIELPVKRMILIKRPNEDPVERPVVEMTVSVGDITQQIEISLTNRTNYEFPLLLGRNFLRDMVVVDVSKSFVSQEKLLKTQSLKRSATSNQPVATRILKPVAINNVPVLGAVETISFPEVKETLPARIDTGAKTSSIDARNIETFKKENHHWVRFSLRLPDDKKHTIELPVSRFVLIKRHGLPSERRPVVKMQVIIGDITAKTEFTLRNRKDYDYPVLIGVRFLNNTAIVDVSKKFAGSNAPLRKKS